jgi:hypothetical protein
LHSLQRCGLSAKARELLYHSDAPDCLREAEMSCSVKLIMQTRTLGFCIGIAMFSGLVFATPLAAQQASAQLNGGRDCQVVRTCNFTKGGTFRGCLSSYTCRSCQMVKSRCTVGAARGTCQELKCGWGG